MSKVSVSVSVSDDGMERFTEVVEDARAAGLEVAQELDLIGVVSGSIEEEQIENLRGVPGVAAVDADRHFEIAPPDSAIQSVPEEGDRYHQADSATAESEPSPDYEPASDYEPPDGSSGY